MDEKSKKYIVRWLDNIMDGDKIKFENGYAVLYNSLGLEIDRVRF